MNNAEETKRAQEDEAVALKRRILHPEKKKKDEMPKNKNKDMGVILTCLFMIADIVLRFIKGSIVYHLISTAYSEWNAKWHNGWIYNTLRGKKLDRKARGVDIRIGFAKLYESSILYRVVSFISERVLHSFVRLWGVTIFIFAFIMVFVAMAKYFIVRAVLWDNIFIGLILGFLALPFVISKKRFGELLISGKLSKYITVDLLNVDETRYRRDDTKNGGNYFICIVLACVFGLLTYFVDPMIIIFSALIIAFFVVIMCFPELGIVLTLLLLPFSGMLNNPTIAILVITTITVISYLFKLLRGKRIVHFDVMDMFVTIFGLMFFFGGLISKGGVDSLKSGLVYFVFIAFYGLIINSYIRKTWIYRGIKILAITTTIVALIGIFEEGVISASWVDMSIFGDMGARVSSLLGNPNMLGAYLLITFPFVLAHIITSERKNEKIFYIVCTLIVLACAVSTWSRGAWLGIFVSVILFLVLYNFRNIWLVLGALLSVPLWIGLLPEAFLKRLFSIAEFSDSSVIYRFNTWFATLNMMRDNLFTGIGVGESAFKSVYHKYAIAGTEDVMHSHNLLLEIGVELGIVALFVFVAIMIMYTQKCMTGIAKKDRSSKSRTMIIAGLSSIAGACVMGITDYIWYNYRVFLLFFAVMGLTIALININNKQRAIEIASIVNDRENAQLEIY